MKYNIMNLREFAEEQQRKSRLRRATYLELAMWLAQGNGLFEDKNSQLLRMFSNLDRETANDELPDFVLVRKWDDKEWHEPTAGYMGLK